MWQKTALHFKAESLMKNQKGLNCLMAAGLSHTPKSMPASIGKNLMRCRRANQLLAEGRQLAGWRHMPVEVRPGPQNHRSLLGRKNTYERMEGGS